MDKTNFTNWLRYSITFRIIVVGVLILLLLIPLDFVKDLVYERQSRKEIALSKISQQWGQRQTVVGPILSIPYKQVINIVDAKPVFSATKYAHFLPEELLINVTLEPQIRSRGIFDAVVYSSKINFSGKFTEINASVVNLQESDLDWNKAFVSVGISDTRGIKDKISLNWNDSNLEFKPGIPTNDVVHDYNTNYGYDIPSFEHSKYERYTLPADIVDISPVPAKRDGQGNGISVQLPDNLKNIKNNEFSFTINLNGSQDIKFIPIGKTTKINMKSSWNNPSFDGAFLPDTRTITDKGFEASWKIFDFNRGYPQFWTDNSYNVYSSALGVKLLPGIDSYAKTERSAKYALLIISLTFLILFFVEVFNRKKIHPIQYILIGLVLVLFYVLLISISELLGFAWAYLIASVSTVSLITLYSKYILANSRMLWIQFLILMFLYIFTYITLQLEDYALLAGSLLLFLTLSIIMYLSRKIDWYGLNE